MLFNLVAFLNFNNQLMLCEDGLELLLWQRRRQGKAFEWIWSREVERSLRLAGRVI